MKNNIISRKTRIYIAFLKNKQQFLLELRFCGFHHTRSFIMTPSLSWLSTKTLGPYLVMKHGYTPLDVNPVFLNQGEVGR